MLYVELNRRMQAGRTNTDLPRTGRFAHERGTPFRMYARAQ